MGSTQGARRLLAAVGAVFMGGVLVLASPASADIVIEFDRLISGQEGWVRTVEEVPVQADHIGEDCEISVISQNQSSVHVGNDLIVTTGTSQVTFVGVEDQANGAVTESYRVVMGSTIKVQLRFGPDELSSMGFSLAFDCDPPAATTTSTTTPASSTTSAPGLDGGGLTADSTTTTVAGGAAGCSDGSTSTTDAAGSTGSTTDTTGSTGATADTTASTSAGAGATTDGCPGAAATATTTTAPASTTSSVAGGSAVTALPPAPPANAVVAAPAYTG